MAPFIAIPGGIQASARFTIDGQRCENVFTFDRGESEFSVAASIVGDILLETWWDILRASISSGCQFREVYMVDLESATGPTQTAGPPTNPLGNVLTEAVPNNVTFSVTLRTNQRGRSFRGRSYVIGIAEGNVLNSSMLPTAVANILDAYETLRQDASLAGIPLCVASRFTNNAPRLVGLLTPVTECVAVDNVVDSQRRRLPGRGN